MHQIALVYLEEIVKQYEVEMVSALKEEKGYRICSIPFFAKHLAIGDLVTTDDEGGVHYFEDILEKSGRSTIRIIFFRESVIDDTLNYCIALGAIPNTLRKAKILVALDVPADVDYEPLRLYLEDGQNNGFWEYEEACLGWK
jgi:hypothetical protein